MDPVSRFEASFPRRNVENKTRGIRLCIPRVLTPIVSRSLLDIVYVNTNVFHESRYCVLFWIRVELVRSFDLALSRGTDRFYYNCLLENWKSRCCNKLRIIIFERKKGKKKRNGKKEGYYLGASNSREEKEKRKRETRVCNLRVLTFDRYPSKKGELLFLQWVLRNRCLEIMLVWEYKCSEESR